MFSAAAATLMFVVTLLVTSLADVIATETEGDDAASDSAPAFDTNSVCSGEVGWIYSGLHCYRLFTYEFVYSDRTWMTASSQCRTHGGKLVSINNAMEAFAIDNMLKAYGSNLFVWIGLSDHEREGLFRWVDGSNLTYTSWDQDEPTSGPDVNNNLDAHVQDYVIYNNNRWRDVPNDWTALIDGVFQPSGFVCEKEAEHWHWQPLLRSPYLIHQRTNSTNLKNTTTTSHQEAVHGQSVENRQPLRLSTNFSMYDEVASRLSEELLAALAWSGRTTSPPTSHRDDSVQTNSTQFNSVSTSSSSRRSWELFLAEIVSNWSSRAQKIDATTPQRKFTPTTRPSTLTTATTSPVDHYGVGATVRSTSPPPLGQASPTDEAAKHQQKLLSALRQYRNHRRRQRPAASHTGPGRRVLPVRAPLNLKSPPAARPQRPPLVSTSTPASTTSSSTSKHSTAVVTTPPAYLRRVYPAIKSVASAHHHQHHHFHQSGGLVPQQHQKIDGTSGTRHNSTFDSDKVWTKPASQLSATTLFRMLGLWTGNDVNVTSSAMTVGDMMRYVLARATRLFTAGSNGQKTAWPSMVQPSGDYG